MTLEPVGCHANRLTSFADSADHIRGQECQLDHLLNTTFRDAFGLSNFGEGFSGPDKIEVAMGTGDVAQQSGIYVGRFVADDEFGFNTALAMPER